METLATTTKTTTESTTSTTATTTTMTATTTTTDPVMNDDNSDVVVVVDEEEEEEEAATTCSTTVSMSPNHVPYLKDDDMMVEAATAKHKLEWPANNNPRSNPLMFPTKEQDDDSRENNNRESAPSPSPSSHDGYSHHLELESSDDSSSGNKQHARIVRRQPSSDSDYNYKYDCEEEDSEIQNVVDMTEVKEQFQKRTSSFIAPLPSESCHNFATLTSSSSRHRSNNHWSDNGGWSNHSSSFGSFSEPNNNVSNHSSAASSFVPMYSSTRILEYISRHYIYGPEEFSRQLYTTWIGFGALSLVTCATFVLMPIRDAIALVVGVRHMPQLTLCSTVLAICSAVPIGWLFEAPDPNRRKLFKRMGLTRGETQGTSLALFYRAFGGLVVMYAILFLLEKPTTTINENNKDIVMNNNNSSVFLAIPLVSWFWNRIMRMVLYSFFFLVIHLMKLHSLSLLWGVITEAMEYEEFAQAQQQKKNKLKQSKPQQSRLQRLAFVGFGGTLGGILGSFLALSMARVLSLSGLLFIAFGLLEWSAQLSIELGRIMQKHWEEQQSLFQSTNDLSSVLDSSMKRSVSLGSMKRIASGNSLHRSHHSNSNFTRVQSTPRNLYEAGQSNNNNTTAPPPPEEENDNTFMQRLLRGITTILRSRLLMAIFMYNALYASTNVLLSFQRAALVVNRGDGTASTAEADTAFLAYINMASSIAVFCLQATGMGAKMALICGPQMTLASMPLIRLASTVALVLWHYAAQGRPPPLIAFLILDETTRVVNLAVAKPVRESLWRGLSNEARYEAKPIVDTLANRWGGGSAAFLVSMIHRVLMILRYVASDDDNNNDEETIFGMPPVLFLCMTMAAWWAMVSLDLGQIRRRIDLELAKNKKQE